MFETEQRNWRTTSKKKSVSSNSTGSFLLHSFSTTTKAHPYVLYHSISILYPSHIPASKKRRYLIDSIRFLRSNSCLTLYSCILLQSFGCASILLQPFLTILITLYITTSYTYMLFFHFTTCCIIHVLIIESYLTLLELLLSLRFFRKKQAYIPVLFRYIKV